MGEFVNLENDISAINLQRNKIFTCVCFNVTKKLHARRELEPETPKPKSKRVGALYEINIVFGCAF